MLETILNITIYLLVSLFGLAIGSFLNVVIYRLPNNMSLVKPSSHCPKCGYKLKWYDNIPVLSYLLLKGKCRSCKDKISPRYMAVELMGLFISLGVFLVYGLSLNYVIVTLLFMTFVCIVFIDLKHYIIPDSLNVFIVILGIASLFTKFSYGRFTITYVDKLLGFTLGLAIILLVFIIERLLKKEIIGGGDLKLITAVGLVIGWELTLLGILFASIIACLVELPLSLNKKLRKDHVLPFGPYLALGFACSLLWGLNLLEWYFGMFF